MGGAVNGDEVKSATRDADGGTMQRMNERKNID